MDIKSPFLVSEQELKVLEQNDGFRIVRAHLGNQENHEYASFQSSAAISELIGDPGSARCTPPSTSRLDRISSSTGTSSTPFYSLSSKSAPRPLSSQLEPSPIKPTPESLALGTFPVPSSTSNLPSVVLPVARSHGCNVSSPRSETGAAQKAVQHALSSGSYTRSHLSELSSLLVG